MPLPVIVAVTPVEGWSHEETLVAVSYRWALKEPVAEAFCRFGMLFSAAQKVDADAVVCKAPARPKQVVSVAISFDGAHWSREDVQFTYKNKFSVVKAAALVAGYAAAVVGVGAFVWWAFRRGKDDKAAETEPFMGAAKPATGRKSEVRKRTEV
jgi:hypothetical protein